MTAALLYTGGMDSLMLATLRPDAVPVYVMIGSPYENAELDTMFELYQRGGPKPTILHGPQLQAPHADGHIVHRNLALITTVAAGTGADEILLGAVKGEASPDKSARFLRATSRALSASEHRPVRVHAPLKRRTKTDAVVDYLIAGGSVRLLKSTRSCYDPHAERCGRCQACFRRWVAFTNVGTAPEKHDHDPRAYGLAAADDWREMLARLRGTPAREWLGMVQNNVDAWRALR